jgi:hypothetical protein
VEAGHSPHPLALLAISDQLSWYDGNRTVQWSLLTGYADRTNIGNAKIEGLQEDLNMSNQEYNNVRNHLQIDYIDSDDELQTLTIFFVSYSCFEPLTQILLKRFRPSIFLPVTMILWGICMTTMGMRDSPC